MRRVLFGLVLSIYGFAGPVQAAEDACRAAMQNRIETCANDCVTRARAAVDPSVRDLVIGRACAKNCLKIEMFRGNVCP